MKEIRRFLAVVLALCLMAGLLPSATARAATGGMTPDQLKETRANKTERLTAAMTAEGWTQVEGVLVPPEIASSRMFKEGRLPVIITIGAKSVSQYAVDHNEKIGDLTVAERQTAESAIDGVQEVVTRQLARRGVSLGSVKKYSLLIAGFSTVISRSDVKTLASVVGTSNIHVERMYALDDASSNSMIQANAAWADPGVDGTGAVVGVVDTGVDYNHPDLGGPGFPNSKIVAGYDFAGDNADAVNNSDPSLLSRDADPMDSNGHGTHVSGIIAANGAVKGVAPAAQIVIAKIVPGNADQAYTSSIVAAFEYMADPTNTDHGSEGTHPPVTVINMSFGSASGFVNPSDPEKVAIEACIANGIVVTLSAGNSAAGSATYPDYATVGSPSVTPGSLSVASIENTVATNYVLHESVTNVDYAYSAGDTSPAIHLALTGSYHYIYCGTGLDSSYFPASAPANTIALIRRGTATFATKINNAAAAGFVGAIIYNNAAGSFGMATSGSSLPSLSISDADGTTLKEQITGIVEASYKPSTWPSSTGTVTFPATPIEAANPVADTVSYFSSWGAPPDLSFKPDLAGVGGNIWSTVPIALGSYANYSGTSMAAPQVAGAAALVRLANPSWTVAQTKLALSNTAVPAVDPSSIDTSYYSPRLQGAGLIQVQNAAKTKVLAMRTGFDSASVALGSVEDWSSNPITFGLTLENFGTTDVTYDATGTVQWTKRSNLAAEAMSGATIGVLPSTVTIPAGQTRNVTVTVNAAAVALSAAYHPFVEGFVTFIATSGSTIDLHVPYMGFLGNWNDFNPADVQFNPTVDLPSGNEGHLFSTITNANAATWLYSLDILDTYKALYPMGITFDGHVHANAVAIHPMSSSSTVYEDYVVGAGTYGLIVDLKILRNVEHLSITVEDASHTVVKRITDVSLDNLEWMGKGYSYYDYYHDWTWDGTNDGSVVVPDGQYTVVARMTPQKVVNKLASDADQVISMPVSVDSVAPVVTITSITPSGANQTVAWNTTDAAPSSGIFGYELYYSTDNWAHHVNVPLSPATTSYDVPSGAKVDLHVVDYAGNWGEDYVEPGSVDLSLTLSPFTLIGDSPVAVTMTTRNWDIADYSPVRYDMTINAPASWQTSNVVMSYLRIGGDPATPSDWLPVVLAGVDGSFTASVDPLTASTLSGRANLEIPLRLSVPDGTPPGIVTLHIELNQSGSPDKTLASADGYTYAWQMLVVTTTSPLPDGLTNTVYSPVTIAATGGFGYGNYTFQATGLPTGLTLSSAGVLSGMPTQMGDFNVHIMLTDRYVSAPYNLSIMLGKVLALHIGQGPGVSISWQPTAGGTVYGETAPISGSTEPYVIQAATGYVIGTVLWNGVPQSFPAGATYLSLLESNITGSNTLAVIFNPNVTVTAGPNGTVTPGTGSVTYHSSPSYLVKPNPGYLIDTLVLDGTPITAAANKLSYTITLPAIEAPHTITATFKSIPDVLAPTITFPKYGGVAGVSNWMDGVVQTFTVHASPFPLQFTLEDNSGSVKWTIKVNGRVIVDPMGIGTITYMLALTEGRNDVEVTGADGAGNWTSQKLIIYLDSMPPALFVDPLPSSVSSGVLTITGSAIDAVSGLASLTINGESAIPFLDGSFSEKVALTKGDNIVVVEAKDKAGNITSQTFPIKYSVASSAAPSSLYVVLTIGSANMEVNGMSRKMDAAPFIKDGRTLLPIRALIENLGGSVQWNASTKTATVMLGSRTVALTIGSKTALVNGKATTLDVAPMIVKGRTFLPLRAVAENIGLDLAWEPISRTISLTYWP